MPKSGLFLFAILLASSAFVKPASATTTCVFSTIGTTMTLLANCTTDSTILVPNGFTLDGNGHTITAVDPAGDHFRGAVVRNGGTSAIVENLMVTASNLANVCDDGNDRLRGILFDAASGSITDNLVININQGISGCQEGNGIEVRNSPFDGTHPLTANVLITGNTVTNYQKNGITANGDVKATIQGNVVIGAGQINYIAQNGVQFGFGGTGTVSDNRIEDNFYTPKDTVACGILYFQATGVTAFNNMFHGNERNICNFGRDGGKPSA